MKYLKIFEAYFDGDETSFESVSVNDAIRFDDGHLLDDITDSEILKLNNIFKCKFNRFPSDGSNRSEIRSLKLGFASKITDIIKYMDDWYLVT